MPPELLSSDFSAAGLLASVTCAGCGRANPASRRFCVECGQALRQACPSCGAEGWSGEAFCGGCGISLRDLVRQKADTYAAALEEARQLIVRHEYDEAAWRLQMVAKLEDDSFRNLVAQARLLQNQLTNAQQQTEQWAVESAGKAQRLLDQQDYDQAVQVLMTVPEPFRVGLVKMLFDEARAKQAEYLNLTQRLTEAQATNRLLDARPLIDRLLALRTGDELASRLAVTLRAAFIKAAKKKLAGHDYERAVQLLQRIPAAARDEELTRLEAAATELHWLTTSLQSAAVVDGTTLALGEHLLKLAPKNTDAVDLVAELRRRAVQAKQVPQHVAPNWSPPESARLHIPVNWLGGVRRLAAHPRVDAQLRSQPGRFFAAIGLALQALGTAQVDISLTATESVGLLGKLALLRKKPAGAAWGLDVGETALKAARLVRQRDSDAITIETLAIVEYAKGLAQTVDERERHELVQEALQQLRSQHPADESRVFASLPTSQVLLRAFRLPPVAKRRVAEAVRWEAKQQLPYALDELRWGYSVVPGQDESAPDTSHWQVIVEATREHHVETIMTIGQAAGWKLDGVQSDGLALHNFILHEYLGDETERPVSAAVAVLDVGGSSSRLLVCSRGVAWCRGLPIGGETITTKLTQSHQLTRAKAEQVKRNPLAARRLSRLYETIDPALNQLADEVERSLEFHARSFPDLKVEQLLGVGGGFALHGLLRRLRSAPSAASGAATAAAPAIQQT